MLRSLHSKDVSTDPHATDVSQERARTLVNRFVIAIALASLSTLSLYVAIPLGVFLSVYAIVCLTRGRTGEASTLIGVGIGAALIAFAVCLTIFACAGFGGMASEDNVGLFTRAISIVLFASIFYLCWSLARRSRSGG